MMLELTLGVAMVLGASAVVRSLLIDRARRQAGHQRRLAASKSIPTPRRLGVGDVLLYGPRELWLAGRIDLDEEGSRIALFRAIGDPEIEWVAQLDRDSTQLVLLRGSVELPEGSLPERLPIQGRLLSLWRRGRARIESSGEHLPPVAERARFTLMHDAGGRIALAIDFEGSPGAARLAMLGDRIELAAPDVLPGARPST